MRTKKTPRKKAIEKLDKVFSLWVRTRDLQPGGLQTCYTCGTVKPWKELHAGHFVTRAKYATRWDPRNVKPQCYGCNIHRYGAAWEFGKAIDREHGEGTADMLHAYAQRPAKFLTIDLEAMAEKYFRECGDFG